MREVSATEASRNFSAVLDSAEHGETILVTRGGEAVATIAPAPRANGAALLEMFSRHAASRVDDEAFAENVARVRDVARSDLDSDPWHG
ncbi:MAG: type II toxin-antitoxin system prevent-host-death family antitoxin [Actinomycetota bacterium]|nr:type II toxin-antitoxin system prevent-host-death family antitoxin [Actinomycetota bacterium]